MVLFLCVVLTFLFVLFSSSASVDRSIVREVTIVRQELFDAITARIACDGELQSAFRFATTKLQKGLLLLRQ